MQTTSVIIEGAAHKFKLCYKNKRNKFETIPNHLRDLVKQLLSHYSQ